MAQRDKEERVRFSGYNIANFKVFIFCAAGVVSSIGGALFTLQVGFMSPNLIGVVPSIDMVIFAAVGGRLSLYGAIYGALLVNLAKTMFSEAYPNMWMFFYGALFIIVVLLLPRGLAGLYNDHARPWFMTRWKARADRKSATSTTDRTIGQSEGQA